MAGTLNATIAIGTSSAAAFTGGSALTADTAVKGSAAAALTGAGGLDVASMLARSYRTAALSGTGVLAPTTNQIYANAANLAASGTLSATAVSPKLHLSDDFNRANSTQSAGPNWTTYVSTILGISSNQGYAPGSYGSVVASYATTMPSDDMSVSVTVGAVNASARTEIGGSLGANSAGARALLVYNTDSWQAQIASQTTWGAGLTNRGAIATFGPIATGDVLTLRRVGNVYTVLRNGVATGATWTDSGNVLPRDASHRMVGLEILNHGQGTAAYIDAWAADQL